MVYVDVRLREFEKAKLLKEEELWASAEKVVDLVSQEVLRRIKSYVPVKTGELRDSFEREKIGYFQWVVTSKLPRALYLEEGVSSHFIEAKRAKYLRFEKEGEVHFAKRVWHPGFLGRRYVERAVDDMVWYAPQIVVKAFSGVL